MTKKRKNSRELNYSTKWKKISSSRTEILVEEQDGGEITSIGFANLRASTRKWATEASFETKAYMTLGSKSESYYDDIEAGRALKELWLRVKKYNDFQTNIDKITKKEKDKDKAVYTSVNSNSNNYGYGGKYNVMPSGGDESFSDDEWEDLLSDFPLDGD